MQLPTVVAISICLSTFPGTNPTKVQTIYNTKVDTRTITVGTVQWYDWPRVRSLHESLGSCKHLLQHYHQIKVVAPFKHRGDPSWLEKTSVGNERWAIAIVGLHGGNTLNGLGILHCLWEYGYNIGYFKHRLHTPVEEYLYMPEDKRIIIEKYMAGLFNAGKRWLDVASFLSDLEDGIVQAKGRKMVHVVKATEQPEEMVASAFDLLNKELKATSYVQPHEEYLLLEEATLKTVLAKGKKDFNSIIFDFEHEYNSTCLASREALDTMYCEAATQVLLAEKNVTIELDSMVGSGGEGPRVHPKSYCGFKFMRETGTAEGRDLASVDGMSGQCFLSDNPDISKLSFVDKQIFGMNVATQKRLIPKPRLNLAVNQFDPRMPPEMQDGTGTTHFLTMPQLVYNKAMSLIKNPTYNLDIGGECIVTGGEGDADVSSNPYASLKTLREGLVAMTAITIDPVR